MALDPIDEAALGFILQVERNYASLLAAGAAEPSEKSEPSLGGKLLYAGELDAVGRALLVAGNIAGAASLAATADDAAQKQAIKDGVADFLVTSLSEALRILKNQIRKQEPAAVCISSAPEVVEREMLERGVLPDLLRSADEFAALSRFISQGARRLLPMTVEKDSVQLTWRVASAPARWLPKLDAVAIDCLHPDDPATRRWLRLAPRYLGRMARGIRLLVCKRESAAGFIEQARAQVERGEIAVQVEIEATGEGICDRDLPSPPVKSPSANQPFR